MQWTSHCVPWQIDCGCFVWALAPFLFGFGVLLFASLCPLAKRKSGWGICGSSCLVGSGGCVFFLSICLPQMDMICPCTNAYLAYAHVRAEPLAQHRPHSRKKKLLLFGALRSPGISLPSLRCMTSGAQIGVCVVFG